MIRFTVVWPQSALDELADIWIASRDRDAVTKAANQIDRELADNPLAKGLALMEGLRSFYREPLRILFAIREDDRIVEILKVKRR
jgi:hypothetical protein